jgi:hypothetical protein
MRRQLGSRYARRDREHAVALHFDHLRDSQPRAHVVNLRMMGHRERLIDRDEWDALTCGGKRVHHCAPRRQAELWPIEHHGQTTGLKILGRAAIFSRCFPRCKSPSNHLQIASFILPFLISGELYGGWNYDDRGPGTAARCCCVSRRPR